MFKRLTRVGNQPSREQGKACTGGQHKARRAHTTNVAHDTASLMFFLRSGACSPKLKWFASAWWSTISIWLARIRTHKYTRWGQNIDSRSRGGIGSGSQRQVACRVALACRVAHASREAGRGAGGGMIAPQCCAPVYTEGAGGITMCKPL